MKYRKKPVVIEAIQWTGDNLPELRKMDGFDKVYSCFMGELTISTLEGAHHASVGDYIIKGVHGEFYPCKPDIAYYDGAYDAIKEVKALLLTKPAEEDKA